MTNKDEAIRLRLRTIWLARPKDFWEEIDSLLDGVIGIARRIDKDDWDEKIHLGDLVQNYIMPWVDDKLAREEHVERNVVDGDMLKAWDDGEYLDEKVTSAWKSIGEALSGNKPQPPQKLTGRERLDASMKRLLQSAPPRTYLPVLTEEIDKAMQIVKDAVVNGRATNMDGLISILPEHAARFNAVYDFWGKESLPWGTPRFSGKTWSVFQNTALPEDCYYLLYEPVTGGEYHFVMFLQEVLEWGRSRQ